MFFSNDVSLPALSEKGLPFHNTGGQYISQPTDFTGSGTGVAVGGQKVNLFPVYIPFACTVEGLAALISTVGGEIEMALFHWDTVGGNKLGSKIAETGSLPIVTGQNLLLFPAAVAVTAGWYLIGLYSVAGGTKVYQSTQEETALTSPLCSYNGVAGVYTGAGAPGFWVTTYQTYDLATIPEGLDLSSLKDSGENKTFRVGVKTA